MLCFSKLNCHIECRHIHKSSYHLRSNRTNAVDEQFQFSKLYRRPEMWQKRWICFEKVKIHSLSSEIAYSCSSDNAYSHWMNKCNFLVYISLHKPALDGSFDCDFFVCSTIIFYQQWHFGKEIRFKKRPNFNRFVPLMNCFRFDVLFWCHFDCALIFSLVHWNT